MVTIIIIIDIWLVGLTLLGLGLGVHRFRRLPMIGPWFMWKMCTWPLLMVYDFVTIYSIPNGQSLLVVLRLLVAGLMTNWEIWYCYHYRFFKVYSYGRKPADTIDRVINAIHQDSGC